MTAKMSKNLYQQVKALNPAFCMEIDWKAPGIPKLPKGYRFLKLNEKVDSMDLCPCGPSWGMVIRKVHGKQVYAIRRPYIRKAKT